MIGLIIVQFAYLLIMGRIALAAFNPPLKLKEHNSILGLSILIPFKNEAKRIRTLLTSLLPLEKSTSVEIIFIDDHSTDNGKEVILEYFPEATILNNRNHGKKSALLTGIEFCQFDQILTLDADGKIPDKYLEHLPSKPSTDMVIGPVAIIPKKGLLNALDRLEQLSIQTLVSGSNRLNKALSASGAHLFFSKKTFHEVGGYKNNEHIHSGDDVFLLQKFKESNFSISYWNEPRSVISVQGAATLREILKQKQRWGGKVKYLNSNYPKLVGGIIFISNLTFILSFFYPGYLVLLTVITIKWLADCLIFWKAQKFFRDSALNKWLPILLIIFPFYNVLTVLYSQLVPAKRW
jgi:glycosyltransferase involved in cell wall biosynthesis